MDNPGSKTLAALQISTAKTRSLLTPTIDLQGMKSCGLEANFQYGSGGIACSAIVATSFDGGTTWRHIARFDFTTAADVQMVDMTDVALGITHYADLASSGVTNGLIGDQLACYIESTGTYVNTTISVRAMPR